MGMIGVADTTEESTRASQSEWQNIPYLAMCLSAKLQPLQKLLQKRPTKTVFISKKHLSRPAASSPGK
jgi:hypothetical protein